MIRDNWDIYLYKESLAVDRGFEVSYGKNMTGLTWTEDESSVVTRIVPVYKIGDLFWGCTEGRGWAKANGTTYYIGSGEFVDSPYVNNYPLAHSYVLEVDDSYVKDYVDNDNNCPGDRYKFSTALIQAAADEFAKGCDLAKLSCEVEFQYLGDTVEYHQYAGLEKVYLYDQVNIEHAPSGFSHTSAVCEIEWDCIKEQYKSIKLGDVY